MKLLTLAIALVLCSIFSSCVAPSAGTLNYPTAKLHPTNKNYVVMPWRPHNAVDVTNYKPGQLGRDPYTAKVDPKTGKRDNNTGRIFRVPALTVSQN